MALIEKFHQPLLGVDGIFFAQALLYKPCLYI